MEKREQLYEGKAKIIYKTDDESKYIAFSRMMLQLLMEKKVELLKQKEYLITRFPQRFLK